MLSQLRWRKILRELPGSRTPLVVICLAIGTAIVGTMIATLAVLNTNIERQFRDANAASATLVIPEGFDRAFVDSVRTMPEIEDAEGRGVFQSRVKVGQGEYVPMLFFAIDAYADMRINKALPERGAWPPADGELSVERSSLRLPALKAAQVGDTLVVEKATGKPRALTLSGLTYDITQEPSARTGVAYGYITLDTLEALGAPRSFNQLTITVAQEKLDERHIRAVVDKIEQKVKDSGRTVASSSIPDPETYWLSDAVAGLGLVLIGLGLLTFLGGLFLVINTITAILAQQVRQIGEMKAIGAQTRQMVAMYMSYVAIYSLLAALIAIPLAALGGSSFSATLADTLNIKLQGSQVPLQALASVAALVFAAPMLAALYPILAGARVTVREAISDYGVPPARLGKSVLDRLLEGIRGVPRPILLSLRNTVRRKGRLILTLVALVLSGAVFMAATNLRAALQGATEQIFTYRNYQIRVYLDRPYRTSALAQRLLSVPGVRGIEAHNFTTDAYRKYPDSRLGTRAALLALNPSTAMFHAPIIEGRWLNADDQAAIVINTRYLQEEPDIRLGDTVSFTINQTDDLALRVVGIAEEALSLPSIYLPNTYFERTLAGKVGVANGAWVATGARDPALVARDLAAQLDAGGINVAKIDTVAEEKNFIVAHTNILTLFLRVMAVLLVIVGALGLMGTISLNVIERKREFGIMRAIGASHGAIQSIVIAEGVCVALLSWLLGVLVAAVPTKLIGDAVGSRLLKAPLAFTFVPSGPITWLIIILVIAVLASYLPARNAARVEVQTLLAYE